jgi:hypothetical protein
MTRKLYRATKDPALTDSLLNRTKHVVTKHEDGSFYCEVHHCTADECASRLTVDEVWSSSLDGNTYVVAVKRTAPYHGRLTVTRGSDCVYQTSVIIAYNAPFGPDAEDVVEWQRIGIEAADADYRRRGITPPSD